MLGKEDVEYVLSRTRLKLPKNVLISSSPIIGVSGARYAGAEFFGADTILIDPNVSRETIIHEAWHETGILNEGLVRIATGLTARKLRLRETFPILDALMGKRKVRYRKCSGCPLCLHPERLGITTVGGATLTHYILVEGL